MNDKKTASLDDLLGVHWLSGVDYSLVKSADSFRDYTDATAISFKLDGIVYTAVEDPSDGYRSCMEELFIDNRKIDNKFPKVKVEVRYAKDEYHNSTEDYLEFVDVKNNEVILAVGTSNSDDYYPSFVGTFYPDRMSINKGK